MLKVSHLGIDIGGAHLKVIGVDKRNKVVFVDYEKLRDMGRNRKTSSKVPKDK